MRYRDPDTGHFISEAEWQRRQEVDEEREESDYGDEYDWDYEFEEGEYGE